MDSASPPPAPTGSRLAAALQARSRAIFGDLAVSRRARNVTGFIFIIAGLLASVAAATIDGEAADLTGRFGIWSAHLLFALFGKAAYLFGPALIWSGLRGIARDDWQAYLSGVIGNMSLLWSLAVFFYLSGGTECGIAGEQFGALLDFFTGRTGAYTINGLLMFTGLLLLLQIPFDRVKNRIIDILEGRGTDESPSAVWLRRILTIMPFVPLFYSMYRQVGKSESPGEAVRPDDQNLADGLSSTRENQAGGTPVSNRTHSGERPPWIQKVVIPEGEELLGRESVSRISPVHSAVTDSSAEEIPTLEEMTDDAIRQAAGGMPVRRGKGNRWRPGVGFDSTEDEAALSEGTAEMNSDPAGSGSLVIEEEYFPFSSSRTRNDEWNGDRLPLQASGQTDDRRNPRIVFDPNKNRYLFRQTAEEQRIETKQRAELLDRMEFDLPDSMKASLDPARSAGTALADPETGDLHYYHYEDEEESDDNDTDEHTARLHYGDSAFREEENVDEWDESSDEDLNDGNTVSESEAKHEPAEESIPDYATSELQLPDPPLRKKSEQPLLPNIVLPPVVLSENRFSRYRLSRRIARQTPKVEAEDPEAEIRENWQRLEKVMADYGIQACVTGAIRGPMITMYEVRPEPGVRVNRILGIQDEIRMNLAALSVRILAPVPGKSTIGIELPNRNRQYVSMGDLANGDPEFSSDRRELSIALGKDITGTNRYLDLTRLPHLLIAGATGSGKSVFMNSVIGSLLFNHSPDEVRFLMIDPKMVELKLYEGIPHLLYPVITDVRLADRALNWAVQEMEARYQLLAGVKCRDIRSYNERVKSGSLSGRLMPYIVILIDELSDLMMVSAKEVEDSIIRLTQKARAVGIHVIMATQRPSVDVITALIKANCPARISFQVSQRTDSRVILDANGAESLLGRGDMLYKSPTAADPARIQSPMISDAEIEQLVTEASRFGQPRFIELPGRDSDENGLDDGGADVDQALLDSAWEIIQESGKTSTSYVQRRLRIGYNRAATIMEKLEQMGHLGPALGNRPREILKRH